MTDNTKATEWVSDAILTYASDDHTEYELLARAPRMHNRAMGHVVGFGMEHYDQADIGPLEMALLDSDLRSAVTVHRPTGEADYIVPAIDEVERGEILSEASAAPEQDLATSNVVLEYFQISSKLVRVHTTLGLAREVLAAIGRRLSRAEEFYAIQGAGASQPTGLVTTAPTTGITLTFTLDELIDVESRVNHSYRKRASWLMSPTNHTRAKALTGVEGREGYSPGHRALGIPPTLLGYPVIESTFCPDTYVFFGDLSYVQYRESRSVKIVQSMERYAEFNQSAFAASMSFDSRLSIFDSTTPPVTKTVVS